MGTYGDLWEPMGTLGVLWGPIGSYGEFWGPLGTYRDLWGRMGTYGDFIRILVFFQLFHVGLIFSQPLYFFIFFLGGFLHTHFDPSPPFLQASKLHQTYHTSCCIHCKHSMPHQTSDIRLYTQSWPINERYTLMLKSVVPTYVACFVGKVCGPLWSTWGAPLGEGKSGVKVGIINTKVARRAWAWQAPPHKQLRENEQHFLLLGPYMPAHSAPCLRYAPV